MEIPSAAVPLLLTWYRRVKRDLPWRRERTPYAVLVSELMLQQTRIEAVKLKYVGFMKRFPTPAALAAASEEEVLKAWEGLGYYARAKNLRRAAALIAKEGFPQTWEGVRALPGVGEYTAGAICSIAFGLPTPAVDGNVVRILSRLLQDPSPATDALRARYGEMLKKVFPPETADFTEALMELGEEVCLPGGAPLCGVCPWSGLCRAHAAGCETCVPVLPPKKERKVVHATVLVLKRGERYALQKRGEKGLLAGLWQFPFFEGEPPACGKVIAEKQAKHLFTHVEWHMTGKLVLADEEYEQYVWATAEEIRERYAIPSAFGAFLPWITELSSAR